MAPHNRCALMASRLPTSSNDSMILWFGGIVTDSIVLDVVWYQPLDSALCICGFPAAKMCCTDSCSVSLRCQLWPILSNNQPQLILKGRRNQKKLGGRIEGRAVPSNKYTSLNLRID